METERWCFLPFICKHKETLVKTIQCKLTKTCRIFANFTELLYKNMGILPKKKSRNFTNLSKNYTLVYITGMFEALSLLVY